MKTELLVLARVLLASLGLVLANQVMAQTFTNLHSFSALTGLAAATNGDGANPGSSGGLILSGNILYGSALYGGPAGNGTVFAVRTDGSGFTNLHSFSATFGLSATNGDGAVPIGLILSGNTLYGTAERGGPLGGGAVFALHTDGSGFTNLYSFTAATGPYPGTNRDGANPYGVLLVGSTLYGTADIGGSTGYGTVFTLHTDSTGFTNLHTFTSGDGFGASGLISSGNMLYGTTYMRGGYNWGTVFSLPTDGSSFTKLCDFHGPDGGNPFGGLIFSGGTLYGATSRGGQVGGIDTDGGTVFAINTNGTGFATLYNFSAFPPPYVGTNGDGRYPEAGLFLQGNVLYGTTSGGGALGYGTVFSIQTDGSDFINLHDFAGGTDGDGPQAAMVVSGNTLYGTAYEGGSSGNGTVFSLMLPVFTGGAQSVTRIAAGSRQSLFVKSDGSLWVTGYNPDRPYSPANPTEMVAVGNVTAVSAGTHSLFLKSDGSLWGFGGGSDGELGDGANNYTNRPEQILAGNVAAIAAGSLASLFLESDGSLWAMGYNYFGELGDGTYPVYPSIGTNLPEQIVSGDVTAVAAGNRFSLFIKSDGSLWGMGEGGGFGGDSTNQPEQIVAGNVTAVAAGTGFSLFLKSDGSLWAVGENNDGQLGDGTTDNGIYYSGQPELIVASNVTAIAAGSLHSLFLKSNGSLWAMGYNAYGQLGDGTVNNALSPEQIVAGNVTAIAAGEYHSLFLKSDGSLWAMGRNNFGQLGLSAPNISQANFPVQVLPLAAIPASVYASYNFVANGDFETGNFFPSWTLSGNVTADTLVGAVKSGFVHSGGYGAQSGPPGSLVYLSQTLSTTPGLKYVLSFWLENPSGQTPNEFIASWNGSTLLDKTNLAASGWTNLQFVVTATDTATILQFGIRDDNGYLGLDDIRVTRMLQPAGTGISLSGTNLVIHGQNGLYRASYRTLMTTNLARPLNQWTPVATNILDVDGNFTITVTNTVKPTVRQSFYLLQLQ